MQTAALIITAIIAFSSALVVFLRNPQDGVRRVVATTAGITAAIIVALLIAPSTTATLTATTLGGLLLFLVLAPLALLPIFLTELTPQKKQLGLLMLPVVIGLILTCAASLTADSRYHLGAFALWVITASIGLYHILQTTRKSESMELLRMRTVLIGSIFLLIGYISSWLYLLVSPQWAYGVFLITIGLICVEYGSTTYQFLDIRSASIHTGSYTASIIASMLFGGFTYNLLWGSTPLSASSSLNLAIVLAVIAYSYLVRLFGAAFEKQFGIHPSSRTSDVQDRIQKMATTLEMDELLDEILKLALEAGSTNKAAILLAVENTNNLVREEHRGFEKDSSFFATADNEIIHLLRMEEEGGETLHVIEQAAEKMGYEKATDLKNKLGQKVHYILPLRTKKGLRGAIALGPPLVKRRYSIDELDTLHYLMREAALATENALIYEEVQSFSSYLKDTNKDLTQRVERATEELEVKNKELEKANRHLEELNNMKTEFLNMASHQLRTPTTVIRGMMQMILNNEVDAKTKEQFLEKIFASADRLNALINDLLNTAYIEGGLKLDLQKHTVDTFVASIVDELKQPADAKGIQLAYETKKKDIEAEFDEKRLHESLYNFVDNAIKYTPEGSVTVIVDADKKEWSCTITDTGIGIKEEDLSKLFQKFYRTEEATAETSKGTGLGLYVAKKIIEEHDGNVAVTSEGIGKGTTFSVHVPYHPTVLSTEEKEIKNNA